MRSKFNLCAPNGFAPAGGPDTFRPMPASTENTAEWIDELVQFLREQPGVGAVRIDPESHQVAVATLGRVDAAEFAQKLAATIAAVEAGLAVKGAQKAPAGFSLKRDGDSLVVGRDTCVTAEKMWLWREMEWPEIKAEPSPEDQEWRTLSVLAAICGTAGIAGVIAGHLAPGLPWLPKVFFSSA